MSNRIHIALPSARELKRESVWKHLGTSKYAYYVIRCHFVMQIEHRLTRWIPVQLARTIHPVLTIP